MRNSCIEKTKVTSVVKAKANLLITAWLNRSTHYVVVNMLGYE